MSEQKRLRRDARVDNPTPMRLTERDKEIIRAVHDYRVLTQTQIQQLFFGSKSTAQYRLMHLFQHGFLGRRFLPVQSGRSPTLYVLDRKGMEVLRSEDGCDDERWRFWDDRSGHEFLAHSLAINDFRVGVTLACQNLGYALLTWRGEMEMKADYDRVELRTPKGQRQRVSVIPDSYFVINTPRGKAHFFLELDRGTMTTGRFQTKVAAYLAYYQNGQYQRRYGTQSLRVLTVTLGQRRLESLKKVTEGAAQKTMFWFGLAGQLDASHVLNAPVWLVAHQSEPRPLIELMSP